MKISALATLAVVSAIFAGCSGIKTPDASLAYHDPAHNIPAIDNMIVEMKQAYIEKCYMPVAKRNPPVNSCQTELFQTLERRYNMDYNQNQVAMASNDLFFKDIDVEIRKMVRTDPEVRNAVRNGAFSSNEEMLAYYKDKYKFDTQVEQF